MSWRHFVDRAFRLVARRWMGITILAPVLVAIGMDLALTIPSDATIYRHYAHQALASPLFHTLPKEYPAAALLLFLVPLLLPLHYVAGFALVAALATVVLLLCSDGLAPFPGWSRRVAIYLLVSAAALVFTRYDVFPALATFLAIDAARRDKWRRVWGWTVVGGLLKLFPLILVPGFLLAEHARTGRWPLRRVLAAGAPFVVVAGVQNAFAPGSAFSPLLYEARRGFEIESIAGGLTLLTDPLHVKWFFRYGSWEIFGNYHSLISLVTTIAMIACLILVWRLTAKGFLSIEASSLATISLAIFGDKAFSPQYIIWLVPLWAYWPLRRGWLTAAALTTLVWPFLFIEASLLGHGYYTATAVSVVRDVVLVAATARWFREQVTTPNLIAGDHLGHDLPTHKRIPVLMRSRHYARQPEHAL